MKIRKCLLTSIGILLASAQAQSCPPGSVLQKGNGWEGCVGSATKSGPTWADRWGAIAMDVNTGAFGASSRQASRKKAEKKALTQCGESGKNQCAVKFVYMNQCASVVTGKKWNYTQSHNTITEAIARGMSKCASEDEECNAFYSDCSLPEMDR
ncbi:DUF4189 domain-containing protein [Lysobacter sp. K5869]|uniref:DUF4189 domain-containing protein n=1 Tax=Lysobacter sp. K5869 TaxID=2820808 RepID=UPI001C05FBD6|nr:DUF4189 domain-containing protein [Lysobacter sp. K5869]QWP75706.1 DUF4189 domain-containing protein [Lysobacter sp. K5869]